MKTNILYVFPFFTGPYGAERMLSDIVNGISQRKMYRSSIMTLSKNETMLISNNIQIYSLLSTGLYKKIGHNALTFLSPFLLIFWFLLTNLKNYQIFHLLNWQSLLVAPIIKLKNPKASVIYHCTEPPRFLYDLKEETLSNKKAFIKIILKIYSYIISKWDSFSISKVDKIISISEWTEKEIKSIYNKDSEIVYPAIEVERFNKYSKVEARRKLKLNSNLKLYITVSKIHPRKKIDESIDLFIKHSKSNSNSRYFIIGGGPDENMIKEYILKVKDTRIIMKGKIESDDEVALYFMSSDYFIFTAKNEPFGIAPLEARSAGCEILGIDHKRSILNPKQLVSEIVRIYDEILKLID